MISLEMQRGAPLPLLHSQELSFGEALDELAAAGLRGLVGHEGFKFLLRVARAVHQPLVLLQRLAVLLCPHRVAELVAPRRIFRLCPPRRYILKREMERARARKREVSKERER